MSQPDPAPTRTLPDKPNLAQLKKQAKELLKAYRAGNDDAVVEVARFERPIPDLATFALADAQRVLARAHGFSSWTALKEQVEGVNLTAFAAAVEAGDIATVRKLAKARPEFVNAQGGGGFGEGIALHRAVLRRNATMAQALLELGADPRAGIWPHRGATTVDAIARDRGYDEIVAIIEAHEERRRRESSPPGATISSKTEEVLKAIVEDRCDDAIKILESDLSLVGACNRRGKTPLHLAAATHNPRVIAWLLDHGAPVNARAPFEVEPRIPAGTPLDYAAMVAGWSAHGRHYTYMETSHKPPAVFDEVVRLLLAHGAELTPRGAVAIGDRAAVLQMNREGRLPNEIHCLRGGLLSIAARVNRPEMVSLLLDLGLDPDEGIPDDATPGSGINRPARRWMSWGMPLWFASLCGRLEIAELLLRGGADVNAIVFASGDALGNADGEDMQALLRKHGAHITVEQVPDRETAKGILDGSIKAYSLNVVDPTPTDLAEQMLWASGPHDPEIVRLCLPHMKRPPADPWWSLVLIHAALPESCRLVLEHGVDPDVSNTAGFTILHHLATDYVKDEHRVARAKILLDAGALLRKRDSLLKSTPLGWACRWGRLDLVKLYLERGADPAEADAEPWATPLAWATKGGHTEIVELLSKRRA